VEKNHPSFTMKIRLIHTVSGFRRGAVFLTLAATPVYALVPKTLVHSIPAPPVGVQQSVRLGASVAVEGAYAVAGAPYDDVGGGDAGVVKVFNSTTGALLFVLPNPGPGISEQFGTSVAVSGTKVAVGARGDSTGAVAAGSAYIYDLAGGTPTVPVATINNPTLAPGEGFGSSVSISGNRVVVGAVNGVSAGEAYVFDLSGGTPTLVATLNNPSPAMGDNFGSSVAISGTRVVAGAPYDDTGAEDAGSAYVYDLTSATPGVPVLTLNNPHPNPGASEESEDYFGSSVAISGNRVVVGAYADDTAAYNSGTAYVYDVTGATPAVPAVTLNRPDASGWERFGRSVAISGTKVVVGAPETDIGAFNSGSLFVFDVAGATPAVPVHTVNNPVPGLDSVFGSAVAIQGTLIMAGAPRDSTTAYETGRAYVFDLAGSVPLVPATLYHISPSAQDSFGSSIALSGTLMVVGAPRSSSGATNGGNVYVYDLSNSGTASTPLVTLISPNPERYNRFGAAVAVFGTYIVVGAPYDGSGGAEPRASGSAFIYNISSATPTVPVAAISNPSPSEDDNFGYSVAVSATRVLVGAPGDDTEATSSGRVYVFDLAGQWLSRLTKPGPGADNFGYSVAVSGDRAVVGAIGYVVDTGAPWAGGAYVYDLTSDMSPLLTLPNPSGKAYDYFGNAVAISGTRIVVGSLSDDTDGTDAGRAYVFDLLSNTPAQPVVTLNDPTPAGYDQFGYGVSISGTRVVVGAVGDDTAGSDSGSSYIFDVAGATPGIPLATIHNPGPAEGDAFGNSVATDGTLVVVGAPEDNTVVAGKGFAYVFGPNPRDEDGDDLLDSWEITHFGSTAGHGPLDDDDQDGYNELLELALGLDPTVPDAGGLPAITVESGYLTLTLTKQPGVTYEVQGAGTLLPGSFSAGGTTVLINDATTLKVRDTTAIGAQARRFLRAKVTAAP
jgi:hypothetical protein